MVSVHDRNSVVSQTSRSERSSSRVVDPPLVDIKSVGVLDSDNVLPCSLVRLLHGECSLSCHVVDDHELNTISDMESSPGPSFLGDIPVLFSTIWCASKPLSVSTVITTWVTQAITSVRSDIASSILPVDLRFRVTSILSDNNVRGSSIISRDGPISVGNPSNRFGSGIICEMLAIVIWVKVHNSDVLLVMSSVSPNAKCETSSLKLGSDCECDTVTSWPFWSIDAISVDVPGLVETVMASIEDNMSSMVVVISMDIKASYTSISNVSS